MEIRKAQTTDVSELLHLRLENAAYHANEVAQCKLKESAVEFFKTHTEDCLAKENCTVFIAIENHKPIGYIIGFINQQHPIFDLGKEALIDDFYVQPAFQKNGIGKLLYTKLVNWFQENAMERINLNVYQNNSSGEHFWKKNGFETQFMRMSKKLK